MGFGNRGAEEREKATLEGPLRDLVFIWVVLGLMFQGFYVFFSMFSFGESCCRLQ